jgi:hypothetical protein
LRLSVLQAQPARSLVPVLSAPTVSSSAYPTWLSQLQVSRLDYRGLMADTLAAARLKVKDGQAVC